MTFFGQMAVPALFLSTWVRSSLQSVVKCLVNDRMTSLGTEENIYYYIGELIMHSK